MYLSLEKQLVKLSLKKFVGDCHEHLNDVPTLQSYFNEIASDDQYRSILPKGT
jgi:hypothetical protein